MLKCEICGEGDLNDAIIIYEDVVECRKCGGINHLSEDPISLSERE